MKEEETKYFGVVGDNNTIDTKDRNRRWAFTSFDTSISKEELLKQITEYAKTKYCVIGEEIAPTTGQKHYQGYVRFENAVSFNNVRLRFACSHWEIARLNDNGNFNYCSKDNNYIEYGEREKDTDNNSSGTQAKSYIEYLQKNSDATWIETLSAFPSLALIHYSNMEKIFQAFKNQKK